MVCDTRLKPKQTISERKEEVKAAMDRLNKSLVSGKVLAKVSSQGAVVFEGWSDLERDGVTDNCAYRRLMATGSALAKERLARAEMLAGRKINRNVVNSGVHSHDGGKTWHKH